MLRLHIAALAVGGSFLLTGLAACTTDAIWSMGIIATAGMVTILDEPPASVELGALESDTALFVFQERTGVTLSEDMAADILEPGDYFPDETPDRERTAANLPSGFVPAGTTVDAFYFHFDNQSYEFDLTRYLGCEGQIGVTGSVTFDQPILGIILRSYKLNQSNDEVGLSTVEYDEDSLVSFPGVNLTDGCKSDRMTLSADRRTLTVRNFTDIHHDNYRVLVAAN